MTVLQQSRSSIRTLADLIDRLGGVPLDRVRFQPHPGTATIQDVIDVDQQEDKLCELVEGVLLEKAMGAIESSLALFIGGLLNAFLIQRNLGFALAPDGAVELTLGLVRVPDVSLIKWERVPGRKRPTEPIPAVVPNLAVEVLSQSNTSSEMAIKRDDYFSAGVELVWEVDPVARVVNVFTSPTQFVTLQAGDSLTGDPVLPGFILSIDDIFGEMDRHG